jgi:hypothetical protein
MRFGVLGMRNKQDVTDYKKLWIASYFAMTDNYLTLCLLHSTRLPVIVNTRFVPELKAK